MDLGVYSVNVDAEQQKVTVSGNIEAATLLNKLLKTGKHAEVWSPRSNHNQLQEQANYNRGDSNTGRFQWPLGGRGLEDQWAFEEYPTNQIRGMNSLTEELDQNTMAAALAETGMEYTHMGDDGDHSFASGHNNHPYNMRGLPSFHVSGSDFTRMGGYHHGYGGLQGYQNPSSMMMTNMQGMPNINNMVTSNNMYMHDAQMVNRTSSPLVPPYSPFYY